MQRLSMDEARVLLKKHGQEHILLGADKLSATDKALLLRQIASIDWSILKKIENTKANLVAPERVSPIEAVSIADIEEKRKEFYDRGMFMIRTGKVGAVMLAGGKGTRLGVDKPKGMVNMGVNREVSIFECLFKNLLKVTQDARVTIPLYIMTSDDNRELTEKYLRKHNFFGYPEKDVKFYVQKNAVCLNLDKRLFFDRRGHLATSPNGNGGWFSSLMDADLLPDLRKRGVEWLNVFAVDNVLQKIADPVFIGATVLGGHDCGAKAVRKVTPEERVGVICKKDGKPAVLEYYEIDDILKNKRNADGSLTYGYGVTLNYLFRLDKLSALGDNAFPVHVAKKKIPYMDYYGSTVTPKEENGYKFESLIVDMVELMESCLCYEVVRSAEFAPVKNATGEDSLESARILLKASGVVL